MSQRVAVEDIHDIEALKTERTLGVRFLHAQRNGRTRVAYKVGANGRPIPLSEACAG